MSSLFHPQPLLSALILLSPGIVRWRSLLDVLSCPICPKQATEATPAPATDWARGWEPACRTWRTPTLWPLSAQIDRPLSGKWLRTLVSTSEGNKLKWLRVELLLISFLTFQGWSFQRKQWRFSASRSSPLRWPIIMSRIIILTWFLPWERLLTLHCPKSPLCSQGTVRRT